MAYQHKRNLTSGVAPTAGQIKEGEIAINLSDGVIWSKSGASVVQVGLSKNSNDVKNGNLDINGKLGINDSSDDSISTSGGIQVATQIDSPIITDTTGSNAGSNRVTVGCDLLIQGNIEWTGSITGTISSAENVETTVVSNNVAYPLALLEDGLGGSKSVRVEPGTTLNPSTDLLSTGSLSLSSTSETSLSTLGGASITGPSRLLDLLKVTGGTITKKEGTSQHLLSVKGGVYNSSITEEGYLKIVLPVAGSTESSIGMTVDIFEGSASSDSSKSVSFRIVGWPQGGAWTFYSANILAGSGAITFYKNVHFQYSPVACEIYIEGNATNVTQWEKPKVYIRDVTLGGSSADSENWLGSFGISFTNTIPVGASVKTIVPSLKSTKSSEADRVIVQQNLASNADYPMMIRQGAAGGGSDLWYQSGITFNPITNDLTVAGDITAFSDSALKENLEEINEALGKIDLLTAYTYDRVDIDSDKKSVGLIAQDVQRVLPEAVSQKGNILALNYNAVVGLLVNAVKELKEKVDKLEGKK